MIDAIRVDGLLIFTVDGSLPAVHATSIIYYGADLFLYQIVTTFWYRYQCNKNIR